MAYTDYIDAVQKTYIAYYQRPADPAGLVYWATSLDAAGGSMAGIIDAFANSAEALALYGVVNSDTVPNVVNGIYQALFNRPAETDGLNYYVNGFNTGTFTAGSILLNILYGASNDDLLSINNKVIASDRFTSVINPQLNGNPADMAATYGGAGDVAAARAFLTPVSSHSDSMYTDDEVTAYIKSNIADPGDPIVTTPHIIGQTYELSVAVDDYNLANSHATVGDDTYTARISDIGSAGNTLNTGDVIDGDAGNNTLQLIRDTAEAPAVTIRNIQTVQIHDSYGSGFDLSNTDGNVSTLINDGSTANTIFTHAPGNKNNIAVLVKDITTTGLSTEIDYDFAPVYYELYNAAKVTLDNVAAGAGRSHTLTLKKGGTVAHDILGVSNLGIETVTITTAGAACNLAALNVIDNDGASTMTGLTVSGDKNLTIINPVGFAAAGGTVDAGAFTGNLSINLDNGRAMTVIGGHGNDTIDFGGSLTDADSVIGGIGYDTLNFNLGSAAAAGVAAGTVTAKVENINLASLGSGTGVNTITLTGGGVVNSLVITGSQDVTVTNAEFSLRTYDAGRATGAQDTSYINFSASGAVIVGSSKSSVLVGDAGNDNIFGGAGNDIIFGGLSGSDALTGGGGSDFFFMTDKGNQPDMNNPLIDTVKDYTMGSDALDVSNVVNRPVLDGAQSAAVVTALNTALPTTGAGGRAEIIILDSVAMQAPNAGAVNNGLFNLASEGYGNVLLAYSGSVGGDVRLATAVISGGDITTITDFAVLTGVTTAMLISGTVWYINGIE